MASSYVDRLSNMPDEVLSEIFSLMPTKYAVRTSILSKRWRYKWTLVTNIDIDVLPFRGLLNCCAFVDRVLDLCKTTEIKLFRLRFSNLWVEKSRMTKWIDEAVRLNVRELDIQSALLELPSSFLACKTLTKLTIESNRRSWEVLDWQTPFNLPSVNAFKLIEACPVLESLSFKVDNRLYEEEYRFSIPTLKHMKLRMRKSEPINKVVLNVPNLEDLFISGGWCSQFVMEDFPSLVSVTFSDFHLTSDNTWPELLKGIIGAKSLYFIANSGLPDAPFTNFLNLKHLELAGGWLKIFQFLERCSELEYLSIVETERSIWIAPHSVATCIPNNLTTIKFENFMGRKDELEFLEYMLGNAEVLKTVTITCKSGLMEDAMQLCAKLQNFPRASKCCEIKIAGKQGCVLIC